MSSILLSAPAVEPLTLAEAKLFLRVEHNTDDVLISALIAGARLHIEAHTRRALITQTWRLVRDAWPSDGRLPVLPAPLQSILAVRVYDAGNVAHPLDLQAFVIDAAAAPAIIAFAPWTPMMPGRALAGIEIDVKVGYGDAAANVPEPLRQAIRLLVSHWYENRGLVEAGHEIAVLPAAFAVAIAPYRVLSL